MPKPTNVRPLVDTRHPERRDLADEIAGLDATGGDRAVTFPPHVGSPRTAGIFYAIHAKAWMDQSSASAGTTGEDRGDARSSDDRTGDGGAKDEKE